MYSSYKTVIWEQMEIWASIVLMDFLFFSFFPCVFAIIIEKPSEEISKLRSDCITS